MAIQIPGKKLAKRFTTGKCLGGKLVKGRKSGHAELQLTSMVDMFTLLVIFLLANFSASGDALFISKDLQLPTSSHGTAVERVPMVAITDALIGVEGMRVATLDEIARDESLGIQQLEDRLRDMKKSAELVDPGRDHALDGQINLQADKRTRFKILKRVMYSCAMAGYSQINFATLMGPLETAGSAATPPVANQ